MIDFTSTRGIDTQSQRCVRLLAAVIAQALKDLMEKPTSGEIKHSRNEDGDAIRSVAFFGSQTFFTYADLVGFSGKEFLNRLRFGGATQEYDFESEEWVSKSHAITTNYISETDLRTVRQRLLWADRSNTNAKTSE